MLSHQLGWSSLVVLPRWNLPANAGDLGSIPGSERSYGGENGNPSQYSYLEDPLERGAWQAISNRVAKIYTTEVT